MQFRKRLKSGVNLLAKPKKFIGVQQVLLHLDDETKAIVEYLCQQSGKIYNTGLYRED